jgi:hypothetical protein
MTRQQASCVMPMQGMKMLSPVRGRITCGYLGFWALSIRISVLNLADRGLELVECSFTFDAGARNFEPGEPSVFFANRMAARH